MAQCLQLVKQGNQQFLTVDSSSPVSSCEFVVLYGEEYLQLAGSGGIEGDFSGLYGQVAALQAANTALSLELSRIGSVINEPFDLHVALTGTMFAFTTVIFFYALSKSVGSILEFLKRG
ncbi:MAG: hypothetical protein FWF12_04035 [Betaproteobacteria bacterium]|nr:hypothetical protein [Betaproteobacteria bacterium]